MAQVKVTLLIDLKVLDVKFNVRDYSVSFLVGFSDPETERVWSTRLYVMDSVAGTVADADGRAMPAPHDALRVAALGKTMADKLDLKRVETDDGGLFCEVDAYITANSDQFLP
jgi:hypothetical protein